MEPLSDADDPALAHGNLGLVATYFEIPGDEFPALAAREAEFNLVAAHPAHPETGERLPHAVLSPPAATKSTSSDTASPPRIEPTTIAGAWRAT